MVGSELAKLLQRIGIYPTSMCHCWELMKRMDDWGVDGCKKNLDKIVKMLQWDADYYSWHDKFEAAKQLIKTGLVLETGVCDPLRGLVLLAIKREEMSSCAG